MTKYFRDDEVVRVGRTMTTNTNGEWSLLTPDDFKQDKHHHHHY